METEAWLWEILAKPCLKMMMLLSSRKSFNKRAGMIFEKGTRKNTTAPAHESEQLKKYLNGFSEAIS